MAASRRALDELDRQQIQRVRADWAHSRDHADWALLSACFHPDATACLAWYNGPAEGFVEGSKRMLNPNRDFSASHIFGNQRIALNGDRAILESDVTYFMRDRTAGYLNDVAMQMLFYDQMEKRDGAWRIWKWTAFYTTDRIDPAVPGSAPAGWYEGVEFDPATNGIALMRQRGRKQGREMNDWIVVAGTAKERAVREAGERWLAGADHP